MTDVLERLQALYTDYINEMNRLEGERANLRGLFSGMMGGTRPGTDSCNDRFAEGVQACMEDFARIQPESDETTQVLDYMLAQPVACKNAATSLMLAAIQGALIPLVEFLHVADAARLLETYFIGENRKGLLPVQKRLVEALERSACR